jgi:hypothetical protein
MNTFSQWVHQHDLLLVCAAVVGGAGLVLVYCRPKLRWWLAWLGLATACSVAGLALRTPAATLYEHPESPSTASLPTETTAMMPPAESSEPDLSSVEAVEEAIAGAGKPTLVEVYADFGLS